MIVALYRSLLRLLLPYEFRARYGEELEMVFADLARRRGVRALASELPGLLRLSLLVRRDERAARLAGTGPFTQESQMFASIGQDGRFALRALRRSPGFTAIALVSLAIGIGANTAVFSLVRGVLLAPLPVRDADRLLAVYESTRDAVPGTNLSVTTPASFFDWKRQATTADLAAYNIVSGTLTGRGEPRQITGSSSLGGMFEILGEKPLFGRTIRMTDEDATQPRYIVLSYGLWRELFGENRNIIDSTITINGTPRTIVGVMPEDFKFPSGEARFWTAMRFDAQFRASRDQYMLPVLAKLKGSATIEDVSREMEVIASRLRRDWPQFNTNLRIDVQSLQDSIVNDVATRLWILMGAVGFVLLITCGNLANLLLARATARRREIAVRRALGAGGKRIARQLLTESLILSLAGGGLGILTGKAFLKLLLAAQSTTNLPRTDEIHLDGMVLAFTVGVSLLSGVLFGTIPVWQLARGSQADALRDGSRGTVRGAAGFARSMLVVSQLALAMVLLTGAGLLLRSFARLGDVDPGFSHREVLTFSIQMRADSGRLIRESLERLRAIPGVASVAVTTQLPGFGYGNGAWFNRLDKPLPEGTKPSGEANRIISTDYFTTLGIPLKKGRFFESGDDKSRAAVIVNEALAAKYYPGEDPIGKQIYLGTPDNRLFPSGTIVGLVGDTREAGLGQPPIPLVYIPTTLMLPQGATFFYAVRTTGSLDGLAMAAQKVVRELDPLVSVRQIQPIGDLMSDTIAPARWSMTLLGTFAAVALVMAGLGIFGVLSFLVTNRTRELGIRMALGAAPARVRRMIVVHGLRLALVGVALGIIGAMMLTRTMESMLYEIEATDPLTFVGVSLGLIGAAALAAYLPARRATRIDPVLAMRSDQ